MTEISDPALLSQLSASGEVTDPNLLAQLNKTPATVANRIDAAESGFLGGTAYLAASPLDAIANLYNLGKAGAGYGYSKLSGKAIPSWLEAGDPNPVGHWLTTQMDKLPNITGTQLQRPDDPASRWLHVAGGVVPGALTGGAGSARATIQGLAGGLGGAGAAQAVHEAHPFSNPTAEGAAEALTGVLGSSVGSRFVPGAPVSTPRNEAVMEGQQRGYQFPAAITNPTPMTKALARMSGGATVNDAAQAKNQPITTAGVREDLNLPGEGPISKGEQSQVQKETNAGFSAVANSGATFKRDMPLISALQDARSRFTNTSSLSPSLASSPAASNIDELMGITTPGGKPRVGTVFNAKDGVATVESLRDAARTAARNSQMGDAAAYRKAAGAIEDAMDRGLPSDLVPTWQAARVRRAQLHTAQDAMDPNGNVDATKLGEMYANDEPMSGNMAIAARSANAAPKAFKVPESGPTGGHGGFWGPAFMGAMMGGGGEGIAHMAAGHAGTGEMMGLAPLALYGSYVGSRAGARALSLADALARQRSAADLRPGFLGAATGAAAIPP